MICDSSPPSVVYIELIAFVGALAITALCSFFETSITSLRLFKIKEMAESSGKRYARLFAIIEHNPGRVIIAILIASSLANVTAAALITRIMERIFAQWHLSQGLGFSLGVGVASLSIMLFGEIIPKNIAKVHGERLLRSTIWATNAIFYLVYPLAFVLNRCTDYATSFFHWGTNQPTEFVTSEKEIQFLIDYIDEHGLMEPEKSAMLRNIFMLGSTPVREIMIPETDVISIDVTSTVKQALELYTQHPYSRIPVYEGEPDNIIGLIHQKDIFHMMSRGENKPIRELVRPIMFVPETIKVNQALREFKQQHMHMSIVLNEHGGVIGLVTLEDTLEEIVGEIRDEHELDSEKIIPQEDKRSWIVDARVSLDDLESTLGITFDVQDVFTLGGFLIDQHKRFPRRGEQITYKNYLFTITKASPKRVLTVTITKK